MTIQRNLRTLAAAVLTTIAAAGCGNSGPKTHAVTGQVVYTGGDVAQLAGHNVEVALSSDPNVRAYGVIEPNGRFKLQTYENGKIIRGAKEGAYDARVVIADEGDGQSKKPKLAVRYLKFNTSGLKVNVPATDDVQLTVATK
ncbi:hypothetical protein [Limnoglobus roseus]|uniref:Carboxypeptidase regulatory-like domain-containing protein n=1 Tax=Limnoglobus roseus TaxID=2598579 RepID=A0A5C1AD47_9BACT|nr:hypothetical protein [Limnoglobus roseus]QEL15034.1 hypothetical protein PX52LOC_01939 [Limnoglobus roseus]